MQGHNSAHVSEQWLVIVTDGRNAYFFQISGSDGAGAIIRKAGSYQCSMGRALLCISGGDAPVRAT